MFPDKLADLLEFRRAGAGAPFEEGGFGRGESSSGGVHPAERDVVVDLTAGGDSIGGDVDAKAFAKEVVNSLADTNMRFDAADEDFPDTTIAPRRENVGAFGAAKGRLRWNAAEERR